MVGIGVFAFRNLSHSFDKIKRGFRTAGFSKPAQAQSVQKVSRKCATGFSKPAQAQSVQKVSRKCATGFSKPVQTQSVQKVSQNLAQE